VQRKGKELVGLGLSPPKVKFLVTSLTTIVGFSTNEKSFNTSSAVEYTADDDDDQ